MTAAAVEQARKMALMPDAQSQVAYEVELEDDEDNDAAGLDALEEAVKGAGVPDDPSAGGPLMASPPPPPPDESSSSKRRKRSPKSKVPTPPPRTNFLLSSLLSLQSPPKSSSSNKRKTRDGGGALVLAEAPYWVGKDADQGWMLDKLMYTLITKPNPKGNNYELYCFCGKVALLRDGRIICKEDHCEFSVPGEVGLHFYVVSILSKLLGITETSIDSLAKYYIPWLKPVCKCNNVLKICIYPADRSGLFWYAMCVNDECEVEKIRPFELKHKFKIFLDRHPDVKPALLYVMVHGSPKKKQ